MNVLLCQIDGKLPNLALMRVAAHHRERGDEVWLTHGVNFGRLFDSPDLVYASAIFQPSRPACLRLLDQWPSAIIGGTGWDVGRKLEDFGIQPGPLDYSIYPKFRQSMGFSQRGCRLSCSFCCVPSKEGRVRQEKTIDEIWRGNPWPREILLLDNDFFGQPDWRLRIQEIRDGGFRVSFNQGINARFLRDEAAEAIASIDYRDDSMTAKRIYTAWDNRKDEERLFAGLGRLVKYGVKPDHIMVYMLCGYWPGETHQDRDYRRARLRDFGARPYPMPFVRTPELVGFQRWVVRRADLMMPWRDFMGANYRPENVGKNAATFPLFET